jgi:hypothetical protein
MMKLIVCILAGAAVMAVLAVPMAAADPISTGSTTGLTSDEIDALGIPWDASLEVWTTALDPPAAQCIGTLPPGTYGDVTVPPGATCALNNSHTITHDLTVLDGARLRDDGAYIGHDLRARNPAWLNITDALFNVAAGTVGHDIHIQGTTGVSPSHGGDNFICDQEVGHDVVVQKSAILAGRWVIGDDDDPAFYGGCGNDIAHDLVVKDNANRVDISGNSPTGGLNTVAGIGHDLKVANNSGGTTVKRNTAGHDCTQSNNSPYVGADNSAGNNNNCNTAY